MKNSITLSWRDINQSELGYRIYRSDSPMDVTNLPEPYIVLNADAEKFVDEDVTFGETKYYIIGTYNENDEVYTSNIEVKCREFIFVDKRDSTYELLDVDGNTTRISSLQGDFGGNITAYTGVDIDKGGNIAIACEVDDYVALYDSSIRQHWRVMHWPSVSYGPFVSVNVDGNVIVVVDEELYLLSSMDGSVINSFKVGNYFSSNTIIYAIEIIPTPNPNLTILRSRFRRGTTTYNGLYIVDPRGGNISYIEDTDTYRFIYNSAQRSVVLSDGRVLFAGRGDIHEVTTSGSLNRTVAYPGYINNINLVAGEGGKVFAIDQNGGFFELNTDTMEFTKLHDDLRTLSTHTLTNIIFVTSDFDGNLYFGSYTQGNSIAKLNPNDLTQFVWERPNTLIYNIKTSPGNLMQDLSK